MTPKTSLFSFLLGGEVMEDKAVVMALAKRRQEELVEYNRFHWDEVPLAVFAGVGAICLIAAWLCVLGKSFFCPEKRSF